MAESSRTSVEATGLKGPVTPGSWVERVPLLVPPAVRGPWPGPVPADVRRTNRTPSSSRTRGQLSWLDPRTLLRSRNEILAHLWDPVPAQRTRWMHRLPDPTDLTVKLDLGTFSFALMGDTGEGDNSQFALLPTLLRECAGAKFLFLCSDVIYPAADVNDYLRKFYRPYAIVPFPIYAVPGNHDWYDNLYGFMAHFCDAYEPGDAPEDPDVPDWLHRIVPGLRSGLAARLRRRPPLAHPTRIAHMQTLRAHAPQPVQQPGPYYVLETDHVRFVCIDPGIRGSLDREQGDWLVRVSADSDKPKVLLSGKPLVVDGAVDQCGIKGAPGGFTDVWSVVSDPAHGYVATIGGDVHNYQHYPVQAGGRTVHHLVSGGGGAFMHATHLIPPTDPKVAAGVTEEQFRCYPLRRDSLAAYSRVIHRRVHRGPGVATCTRWCAGLEVTPEQAHAYLERHGFHSNVHRPARPEALTRSARFACGLIMKIGGRGFHRVFSPFLDWDDPPFFKNFLRLDVSPTRLTITCFSVTGAMEQENERLIEDTIEIPLPVRVPA